MTEMEKKKEEQISEQGQEQVLNQDVSNDELEEVSGGVKYCIGNAAMFHLDDKKPIIKPKNGSSH